MRVYGVIDRVERLGPHMVRTVLGGPGLEGFDPGGWTDAYVNIYFPADGVPFTAPVDVAGLRALPATQRPPSRRYSVRRWDAAARELTIDFVVHDGGVAGGWAGRARPGDVVPFTGPGGSYRPDADADWHLMVGDESALPAIAASLEAVPPVRPVHVLVEVDGPDDELALRSPGDLHLTWLHRAAHRGSPDDLAAQALAALERPAGRVHAFVHGEAVANRALRRELLGTWEIPRADLSISPYWRRGDTDETWREVKKDWLAEVERDL